MYRVYLFLQLSVVVLPHQPVQEKLLPEVHITLILKNTRAKNKLGPGPNISHKPNLFKYKTHELYSNHLAQIRGRERAENSQNKTFPQNKEVIGLNHYLKMGGVRRIT